MVRTHAQTIVPTTLQCTAEKRLAAPTPIIDDEITCVVLSGMPKCEAPAIINDAAVSAAKP